jgi:hypothetical protein
MIGGLVALALGSLSLTLYQAGFLLLGNVAAVGQGFCVVVPLGTFTMHMALYTKGHPSFNMSGGMGIVNPSPQISSVCFVMAHAYLTCPMFVVLFERPLQWHGDSLYSMAANIASNITLVLAYGTHGMHCHALITVLALLLESGGGGHFHAIQGHGTGLEPIVLQSIAIY